MSGRNNVSYIKPAEPKFLAKFKKDVGYKEGPSIETKREESKIEDFESRPEQDDEKPVVVVLEGSGMTQKEAEEMLKDQEATADPTPGKMTFKKPTKRTSDSDLNVSSSKKKKDKRERRQKKDEAKGVKNSSLLSFGEEEEEET